MYFCDEHGVRSSHPTVPLHRGDHIPQSDREFYAKYYTLKSSLVDLPF